MAPYCPLPEATLRFRMTAACLTWGAICLSSSSHFPLIPYSADAKPVALPPGRARLSTKPPATGQMLAIEGKKLARCNPVRARYLRHRPVWPRRFCDDPQFFFPAPAPTPFNRRDHLNGTHRAMPIVTISIALRACSPEKQGSRQKTLTYAPV